MDGNSSSDLLKLRMLEILDEFVRVCQENNLRYFLAFGTCLGAVRHHGMIPWDNDIDVAMPREDYERLYELRDRVFCENFRLLSYRSTPGYHDDIMRVESLNTTMIYRLNPIYVGGVYIDIFPLENVSTDEQDKQFAEQSWIYYQNFRRFLYDIPQFKYLHRYLWYLKERKSYLRKNEVKAWDTLAINQTPEGCPYWKEYHSYGSKGLLPKEVYGEGNMMLFENKYYVIPKDYDTYLKAYYGDYMQFPPEEERKSAHLCFYMELTRRITKDEQSSITRNLYNEYGYKFNLKNEVLNLYKYIVKMSSKFFG